VKDGIPLDITLDYFSERHWDRVAQARGSASSDVGAALIDSMVTSVDGHGATAILDIGSGNGALANALAATFTDAIVRGVDYSSTATRIAEQRLAAHDDDGVRQRLRFVTGPAVPLPFDDNSFDAITLLKTAWVLPDLPAALRECRRVLRPGGRIHVQTWSTPQRCAALTLGSAVIGERIGGFVLPPEATGPFELTTERIAHEMSSAGLVVEAQPVFSWDMRVRSCDDYWERLRSVAGTAFWALATQPTQDRMLLDDTWRRHSEAYRDADGWAILPLDWHVSVGELQ
jgi:ubiquinone/menaquinone biosynthesis C-methylase UbiE